MMPIPDLLHRIRRDPDFGRGELTPAYCDRLERKLIVVPLHAIEFPPDRPGIFRTDGPRRRVAQHPPTLRQGGIKNGTPIWQQAVSLSPIAADPCRFRHEPPRSQIQKDIDGKCAPSGGTRYGASVQRVVREAASTPCK